MEDTGTLRNGIEARLRETAAQQEAYWVKVGRAVFPASVTSRSAGAGRVLTVTATLRDRDVKRELQTLQANPRNANRLTWGADSTSIVVRDVAISDSSSTRFTVEIVSQVPRDEYNGGPMWETSSIENGRTYGPEHQNLAAGGVAQHADLEPRRRR